MMRHYWLLAAFVWAVVTCNSVQAQDFKAPWEEFDKRLKASQAVGALNDELFGDRVSLPEGSLSFSATDVDLPGNDGLRVSFSRKYSVYNRWRYPSPDFALGDWDLDVPNISGIFAPNWTIGNNADGRRCSLNGLPTLPSNTDATYRAPDFWHGNTLHIPGVVSGELLSLRPGDPKPSTGETYLWTTSDRTTRVSCLDGNIQNGTGEGFLVITADGTKYWFDWMAQYGEPNLGQPGPSHPPIWPRKKNVLYATKVKDRFGNTVTYKYTNSWNARAKLISIAASDGRLITIDYSGSKISAVHAGGRTWSYSYNGNSLSEVRLPDLTNWTINFAALTNAYIEYPVGSFMEQARNCMRNIQPAKNYLEETVGTITHPSGAIGTFRVGIREHGRSNVPIACKNVVTTGSGPPGSGNNDNDPNDDINLVAISYDSLTLLKKTISGPSISPREWNYSYTADITWKFPFGASPMWPVCYPWSASCLAPSCLSDECAGSAKTSITGPGGDWVRYTYGNSYNYNEGKLLKVERGSDASHILRIDTNHYDLSLMDQAYPATAGGSARGPHEGFAAEYTRPLIGSTISQQDEAFEWNVTTDCPIGSHCFDEFARPLEVVRSNTLDYSKTDTTEYYDDYSLWVLGQVARTTTDGIQTSRTEFIHKALPWKMYGAGDKLLRQIGYYTTGDSDGLISSINDGNGNKTRLLSWKRGVPQSIQYPATIDQPDGVDRLINVDDNGWIRAVTDENNYKTSYGYDVMGRMTSITYPAGDIPASTATALAFAQSTQAKYGLQIGHWQQTVHTGNGYKIVHLDEMWRPVVEERYGSDNEAGTRSIVVKRYDSSGRLAFQSYPVRNLGSYTEPTLKGVRTYYDALGRVTQVDQDSELGVLTTTNTYLDGFKTKVVDPRGNSTTTSFMAYDQPTTDWPVAIVHPGGVYSDIGRDVFGKPTSISRGNADGTVSLTRDYAYNSAQELCASVEPETGTTKYGYDGAGNLTETISGMPVSLPATCGSAVALGAPPPTGGDNPPSMAATVHRTYDARNRLKYVDFPDHRGDTTYTYTADGLLESVAVNNDGGSSQIVTTSYAYNHRRLLTSERMDWNAIAWTLETGYDANGHVAWHSYPSGDVVDYAPNALGQPTRVGNYATDVSYYPNGAIEQFTYGNGIVHSLSQNVRGLVDVSTDAYGARKFLSDGYDYDENANVVGITDGATDRNQRGNRDMAYDALDRLTGVTSQMFGDATYSYDALDNLTRVEVGGGNAVRDYYYCYDGNWRLTNVKTGGCSGSTVMGLGYDAQGNLQNRNGVNFDFDYGNRLRSVQGVASYAYDGRGRRVRDLVGASKYSLYSMTGQLMYTSDDRKKLDTSYFYLGGSLVAKVDRANVPPLETPSLTVPTTSSTGAFTARWSEIEVAERYELQQRKDGGSWSRIHNDINRSHSISGLVAGMYEYRVRACNAAGCGGFSEIEQTVVTMPPGNPPTLTVPAADNNGAFTVNWTSVVTSTGYHLRQRRDGGAWSEIYGGAALSKAVSGLTDGTYEYQVKACNGGGCSAYSAIESTAVTFPPTGVPGLTVPAADNNGAFAVSWTSVSLAGRYELQQRKDSGSWSVAQNSAALSKVVSGLGDGSYEYRVRACNDGGCAGFSAIKTAVVTYPPTGVSTLTVPTADNNGAFAVSWTAVSAASRYELQQRKDGGSWSVAYNSSGLGKTTSGLSNGSYEYRVRACNAGGCAAFSAIKTAVVTHPPANAPTLTVPATDNNGAFTASWTSVSTSTSYRLEQRKDGGAWSQVYSGAALSKAVSGLANGTYGYRARACNAGGCSAYSASKTTVVTHPPAAPGVTAPAADNNGAFTVSWTSVSTSTSYRLEQRKGSGAWGQIYSGTALSKAVSGLTNGTYGYRARACNTGGCSAYSAVRNTVVTFPPSSAPALSAPGGLINSHEQPSFTVSWSTVATASRYELESKNGASWETTYSGSGTSKSFMIYRTNGFASYRVRACNAGGCGPYSATKSVSWEDMGGCDPETRICDDPRLVEPGEEI